MRRFNEAHRRQVFWWSPPRRRLRPRRENVGDYLSPLTVQRMLDRFGWRIADKRPDRGRLLAIGSVLHFARDGDVVWGAGVNGKVPEHRHRFEQLDVRAVRGPLTRDFLLRRGVDCPAVYGDPALLMPALFPEFRVADPDTMAEYVVIPHLNDSPARWVAEVDAGHILWPTAHWKRFVRRILASRLVISASLHGLVIAEAYGIPARALRLAEGEPQFKYADYYLGTDRPEFRFARSVGEALRLGGEAPPRIDLRLLMNRFPVDLWLS